MDPAETYRTMMNESLDQNERTFAALDLLVWIAKGGEIAIHVEGLAPRSHAIGECELIIIQGMKS
jgi:hypothetical protein